MVNPSYLVNMTRKFLIFKCKLQGQYMVRLVVLCYSEEMFLQIGILVNHNIRKCAISSISRHMLCTGINIAFIFILTVFSPKRKKIRKLNTTFILTTCFSAFIGVIANSIPKLWGLLWILCKLIGVNHMYSSPSFYPMQNHPLCYLLINMSFFTTTSTMSFFNTSTDVSLCLPQCLFVHST